VDGGGRNEEGWITWLVETRACDQEDGNGSGTGIAWDIRIANGVIYSHLGEIVSETGYGRGDLRAASQKIERCPLFC
jgi:hypothetical protein